MPPSRLAVGRGGVPRLLLLLVLGCAGGAYRPVVIIHGLFDSPSDFRHLRAFINESHPGTEVTVLDLFDRGASLRPLWLQVEGFRRALAPIMANAADGVHLLGYSQGGLISRALLATTPDHNVRSFISLAAPQMGQYGDTAYLQWLFPRHMKSNLYRLCYTPLGQGVSICNYWNDPHHRDLYLNSSDFLAPLNDERMHPNASAAIGSPLTPGRVEAEPPAHSEPRPDRRPRRRRHHTLAVQPFWFL
ncbi:lysosomal thioesterase PPT2 isoform X3 [Cuculus canorus]|uniref:lysosomal thioesterase PPT2 isoform X3 n=1 Tax=Cuculus canorus TaxID=55661 RepID=UPI0023AA5FDF|nr:lysosomal thioesterase PPT2 isoform X3 [Cuculus canorus]